MKRWFFIGWDQFHTQNFQGRTSKKNTLYIDLARFILSLTSVLFLTIMHLKKKHVYMIVEEIIIFAFSVFKQIERNDKFSPCKICRFFCPGGIIFFFRPKIVCINFCFNFIRSRIRRNEKILTIIVFCTCSYHQMIACQFLVVSLKSSEVKLSTNKLVRYFLFLVWCNLKTY